MKVILPDNVQEVLQKDLERGFASGKSRYSGAHNILMAVPQLATEATTRAMLERTLLDPAIGYRWYAAKILMALGDPLGMLHLTYNSLTTHPILKQDNTRFSGWHEAVLPCADKLDSQCVDLLAEEMMSPGKAFHGVSLAIAGEQLDATRIDQRHAAFQAGWRGDTSALDNLIGWLADCPGRHAVATWALIRNVKAAEGVRRIVELCDPQHTLYDSQRDPQSAPFLRFRTLPLMQFARAIDEATTTQHPLAFALLSNYLYDFEETFVGSAAAAAEALATGDLGNRYISARPSHAAGIFPASLLAVFQDLFPDDLRVLSGLQSSAIRRYVKARAPIPRDFRPCFLPIWMVPPRGVNGIERLYYHLDGMEVIIEESDLEVHGNAWLTAPLPHAAAIH